MHWVLIRFSLLRICLPCASTSALAFTLLSAAALPSAFAQPCTPDPFGGEVCLPDVVPPPPDEPPPDEPPPEDPFDPPNIPGINIPPYLPPGVVFDRRQPYRVFEPQEPAPEPAPAPEPEPAPAPKPAPKPIRALWFKSGDLPEPEALDYVERALRQQLLAQVDNTPIDTNATGETIRFGETDYLEILEPNTLLYSQPYVEPGVNVWVSGYGSGGQLSINNRSVDLNSGGVVLGFDVDLSPSFSLGLYGNYTSANTSGNRGSWSPDGWGGGIAADWWTDNFYIQGLVGGNAFSGTQKRSLKGNDARGERSGSSWNAAVRIGAPIDAGSLYLEPQAQLGWVSASFDSFRESGVSSDQQLRYGSSNADALNSELAIKIGVPIRRGERSLLLPSLRLGWIANWGQNNGSQSVRFVNGGPSYSFDLDSDDANGFLVEAGLDYTTFNFTDTSVGVFLRGGPVFYGNELGTAWRAWGGLNFKF